MNLLKKEKLVVLFLPVAILVSIYFIEFDEPIFQGQLHEHQRLNFKKKTVDYDKVDLRQPAFKKETAIQRKHREDIYKKGMSKSIHIEWSENIK